MVFFGYFYRTQKNSRLKNPFYLLALLFLISFGNTVAQTETWFYLRAVDNNVSPNFTETNGILKYTGSDSRLAGVLSRYEIYDFKKTLRNTNKKTVGRTFFVRANSSNLLSDLLQKAGHAFASGEQISKEDMKIYEPNDYGLTSTIGDNLGMQANLDYLDFLGLPKAWYYTTGNKDFYIGISDGIVDTTDIDFRDKTTIVRKSRLAKGHGYSIGANAAAQGDNGHGIPGVCYDCKIYSTTYGDFAYLKMLKELSDKGVKVINCSWSGRVKRQSAQDTVNAMFANGTLIVATAGNEDWKRTRGELVLYPAAYDHVISVSSGMYKYDKPTDNLGVNKSGEYNAGNIKGYVGRALGFKNNDTLGEAFIWGQSTANLNRHVDILAPTAGLVSYGKMILNDTISYSRFETTSGAAPLVSGTIALMQSLNPCLPTDEVESILKITAMNIDHIPANRKYKDMYGAGMLQTGDAVEMVYKLYTENETAYIEDQAFSRWNFKVTALSEEVKIQNQKFTESASLKLKARNRIVIGKNTVLRPNNKGSISLKIDPNLQKQCDLVLRDPSIAEN